ncbi:DUF3717 domain-containing protein [Paraburkholderia fungorum]|uniref:DUF3717 domain-containing protein n=1 Tax=Paraburkholderia fungorum TaxID=134537 RepID=UPI00402B3325
MSVFSIAELEVAINRCLAGEPSEQYCLGADGSRLGGVYGLMIWNKEESRSLESLDEKELAAFTRWRII